jgi:hypothetical protein
MATLQNHIRGTGGGQIGFKYSCGRDGDGACQSSSLGKD